MFPTAGNNQPLDYGVLASPGWLEWNSRTWGLQAHRVSYSEGKGSPSLFGVLYTDARGHVRMPPLNPFLPFRFESTSSQRSKVSRQWETVAGLLAKDLTKRRIAGRIGLSPGLWDSRPFQWAGLHIETKYTHVTELPYSVDEAIPDVRRVIKRATEAGFRFEVSTSASDVVKCLQATASRKGFKYLLNEKTLSDLFELMTSSECRGHVVRDKSGNIVSGGVQLLTVGGMALNWVQGTEFAALKGGAAQLMYHGALDDLAKSGGKGFDFGGANTRSVSAAKANWGMELTPYITIGQYGARQLYKSARGAVRRLTASPSR